MGFQLTLPLDDNRRSRPSAFEANLLTLGEQVAIDPDPEAQTDVAWRFNVVQQLTEGLDGQHSKRS